MRKYVWLAAWASVMTLTAMAGGLASRSLASGGFPPVHELQDQLHAHPGDPLPRLIVWGGRTFQPHYEHAEERGRGEYTVTLRLVPQGQRP